MNESKKSRAELLSQGITLNSLLERRQSLNARMLWAMQQHDEDEQEQIKKELSEVQGDIDCMTANIGLGKGWNLRR